MITIPEDEYTCQKLTSLRKIVSPESGFTKRDLLAYYLKIPPVLLPHLKDHSMVMKRYPNGIAGEFFFMATGSRGVHVYIPIQRSPLQKEA